MDDKLKEKILLLLDQHRNARSRKTRPVGVRARGLRQSKLVFDLVVRCERPRYAVGKQKLRIAELRDDFLL